MTSRPPGIPLGPDTLTGEHLARYWPKVDSRGECHEWTAATNNGGYGVFRLNGRQVYAHRLAWVIAHQAPLPTSLTIDHVCRNRTCVNPEHLEAVTHRVNTSRQPNAHERRTHCPAGHEYAGANLYRFPDGRRACRACQRAAQARYVARKKASA